MYNIIWSIIFSILQNLNFTSVYFTSTNNLISNIDFSWNVILDKVF